MASRLYESDITRLLREVASDPEVDKSRREGRSIYWDRKVDFAMQKRLRDAEVPPKGYVYDTSPPLSGHGRESP